MSEESQKAHSSMTSSLRKQREELIVERKSLISELKIYDSAFKSAVASCPPKESGNLEDLEERIETVEEELEVGSRDAKEERALKRDLLKLKQSYDRVMQYIAASREIDIIRNRRSEKSKRVDELSKKLDELAETVEIEETLSRIESSSGKKLTKSDISKEEVKVPKESIGRLVGKNGSNIQKLEKQFSVRIMTNEEVFTVLGELANVKRCIAELTDMANEKEVTIPLSTMQIRALLAHDHSYRRSIENSCRVFMTLKDAEVTIRGGQNAVKNAERALNDLMKKQSSFPITPFLRSVLVNQKMEKFLALQKECPAYLTFTPESDALLILGTVQDQRESLAKLQEFAQSHVEVEEKLPCENLFTRFLLQNKAERMQQTQRQFNVRLQASNGSLVVKGEKDAVAQAIAKVEALRAELASRTIEMAVNGAQIDMLLNQKAAVVQALEQEFGCLISVESAKGSMKVVVDEARREETVEAINAKLATVCTERVEIPECLLALFVGPKGSNINAMRQAHDTKAELAKGVLEISGKEENVAAMKKAVEEWLEQHTIAEIPAERQLAREALIGEKGAKIQSLRKELAVEIQIEEGKVVVIGAPENVEKAVATLTQLLDTYRKENAVVAMRHEVFVNAKELRRSEIDAREKEWNVSMSLRHDAVYIHGDEASVAKAKQEIEDIVAKYAEFHEDSLDVPKEEIGVLLGKNGDNLRALESQLGVSVHIEGSKLRIWGPASALPAAKAGIVSNLEERVYLTEELNCTGKQIEFLRAERFEVVHAIQNAYNVTITLPREFPLSGPIKVAVRGNRRQLDEAIPVVREALQGLIRCELHLDGMVHRLLTESSLQFQRLALESRCRIQPDEAAGLVRIVGPKQGVELVQVRVWEQLAALDPSLYRKIDVSEAVLLGLQEKKDAMKTFSKQHGVQLRLLPQAVLVEAPAAAMDEAVAFVQTLADAAAQESLLIPVGQDRVAFVIGAQGARINGIIKQSGAQLRVLRDEWVHVLGTPEQAAKARALLEAALEEYAATHVAFQVDEALVYAIRGPRNSNLVRIERECRVRVRLEQDGAVSIVGNAGEDVANARAALEKLEEEARANPEQETAYRGGEKPRRREREQGAEERKQKKEREAEAETPAESVWEKLKRAPLLPSKTVGGSDMYKSESGYTVEL